MYYFFVVCFMSRGLKTKFAANKMSNDALTFENMIHLF